MKLENYERTLDKTFDTFNTAYSFARKIGYIFMSLFFMVLGGGLLVWGISTYSDRVSSLESYQKTTGTVVEMREVPETENSGVTYAPVIKFSDEKGREFRHSSSHSSDPPAYKIGERVELFYDKGDPESAFINSFWGKWWGTIILFTCPAVLFPVGFWMLFSAFRRKNSPAANDHHGNGSSYVSIA